MKRLTLAALLIGAIGPVRAVDYMEDNSFLLEEAYNQEPGVIQHIQTFQKDLEGDRWSYGFTQEWPAPGRRHQLSVTIPGLKPLDEASGVGDVLLNYRRQLVDRRSLAFSPRLSVVLPTGDEKRGLGRGATGVQSNLPLSLRLSESVVTHYNLGATLVPSARNVDGARKNLVDANYGASAVYHVTPLFDLLFECVGGWTGAFREDAAGTFLEPSLYVNPGLRYAINTASGLQIVPGIAYTVGLGPSRGERLAFFYLSLEHPLRRLPSGG